MSWRDILCEAMEGRLMALLHVLPREQWAQLGPHGETLLHQAAKGDNADAARVLLAHGLDPNALDTFSWTPAHWAARFGQARVLGVLCAAGANVRRCSHGLETPLELALLNRQEECVRLLLACGLRLRAVRPDFHCYISAAVEATERGLLRCRSAAVALLRAKHAAKLVRWDRFVLVYIARLVWTTRLSPEWHPHAQWSCALQ